MRTTNKPIFIVVDISPSSSKTQKKSEEIEMKHCTKSISIVDETSKTVERNKKGWKSNRQLVRKPLCNDQLLKNYFESNTETDRVVVYRISKESEHVKQHVLHATNDNKNNKTNITTLYTQEIQQSTPPSHVYETNQMNDQEETCVNSILQNLTPDEHALLLQIYCSLIQQHE